jgi:hypothetical protein
MDKTKLMIIGKKIEEILQVGDICVVYVEEVL